MRIIASRPICDTRTRRLRSGSTDHRTEPLRGGGVLLYVFRNTGILPLYYSRFSLFILFFKFHADGCSSHIIPRFLFRMVHSELLFNLLGEKMWKTYPFCSDLWKKDVSTHVRIDVRVFRSKISISWNCLIRSEHEVYVSIIQKMQSFRHNFPVHKSSTHPIQSCYCTDTPRLNTV